LKFAENRIKCKIRSEAKKKISSSYLYPTKPDKNYNEPGLMSMSPIRLIAYSPYTFSRFFNGAIGKHPDVRFSVGAIGKHPDEVYVKRKRKSFFRACINRSPRRIHAVLQFENEGGVIDKKLLQILLFRGKLVVNSSFGTSTCLPRALIRLGSRHTCAPTQVQGPRQRGRRQRGR